MVAYYIITTIMVIGGSFDDYGVEITPKYTIYQDF